VVRYGRDRIEELEPSSPERLPDLIGDDTVTWIDVQGLGDEATLRTIGAGFAIHPLALEDVVNAPQRPKIEEFPDHLLLLTRMVRPGGNRSVIAEQVSLFVGRHYVLSFQERYGDVFDPVRVRLREAKGVIRSAGPDYLGYALLDTIIDGYYPVLDEIGDALTQLELRISEHPSPRQLERLNHVKATILLLQRGIAPQRDALGRLLRDGNPFVGQEVQVYLRDTMDHAIQVGDALDGVREIAASLFNTYLSLLSHRTNEVMKVLTIMASIFIPLTFLAGLYGMNFERMPELHKPWGYPVLLAVMAVTAVALLLYFRWRGWIGRGDDPDDE
jgi:magnesium transporter